jgi:hypothetical protein
MKLSPVSFFEDTQKATYEWIDCHIDFQLPPSTVLILSSPALRSK